jgi:cysteine synthase
MTPVSRSVLEAIGNTPLVELHRVVPPGAARLFVKLESVNRTGSYKDRMALAMIEGAERRGDLKPGMRVLEYTGGSTGSSLGMVCAVKGYSFTPVCSDAFAREKLATMRAFGGELTLVPSEGGRITPALFDAMKAETAKQAAMPGVFYTNQFHNDDALDGYAAAGREILNQLEVSPDAFCAAVGTAGMLVGVSRALKKAGAKTRIVALEPVESPFLSSGHGGAHRIEGIGTGFWPPHLRPDDYDETRTIPEADARHMARRLASEEGILAGTSSGLNVVAAIRLAVELGPKASVVTLVCDSGLKYLSGDLFA